MKKYGYVIMHILSYKRMDTKVSCHLGDSRLNDKAVYWKEHVSFHKYLIRE